MQPSDHDPVAARFTTVVAAVTDWDAPTPVPEWRARDVVHHLTTWLPGLLGSCGVELPVGALDDPVGSWATQDTAVRRLLAERGAEEITHAFLGTKSIGDLLAQIYIPDVFMHTWDLARSAGLDDALDPATCHEMVTGMAQMEDVIRSSGQFGTRWAGDPGEDPQRQLVAFIGRDPDWQPQP
jgi:uncharacterized protein (TIGR03086 family)